jgi:hypothetical protein
MRKVLIILFVVILNIYCEQKEDIAECNIIDINHQRIEQMTINEQEEYVNK